MRTLFLLCASLAMTFPSAVQADVTFEGFFRIEKNKSHIGYAIHRAEWDPVSKKRVITLFIKTNEDGKNSTSVTRSISDENFLPLCSVAYSTEPNVKELIFAKFGLVKTDKKLTTVDTQFDKNIDPRAFDEKESKTGKSLDPCLRERFMSKPSNSDKIAENEGSFQSSFLFYILNLGQLEVGKSKTYEGFSEEDGRYSFGKVKLLGSKTLGDLNIFQIDDDFAGEPIENFVLANGDPVGARSIFNKIVTHLTSKSEAVGEFDFNQKELIPWFKGLPEGTKNPIVQSSGKLNAFKIIEAFAAPKGERDPSSEEIPVVDIKVPQLNREK